MKLPVLPQKSLNIQSINWNGLPKRFLNPGELEVLVALVRSVNATGMLEFGVNEGRTAKALLDNVKTLELYQGIDVLPGYYFAKHVQRNEVPAHPGHLAKADERFQLLLSAKGSFDLKAENLAPADAIFIDGDHGREAVEHDTALARQIVRPGGIIIWHDYHDRGTVDVREVLDEMYEAGAPITRVDKTWIAFERIPA